MKLSTLPRDYDKPRPGEAAFTPEHAIALLDWYRLKKVPAVPVRGRK